MKKIFIYGTKHTANLGGRDPEDRWTRDSTETSWSVVGASEKVPSAYDPFDDIETGLESGKGYALYMIHSSGDSFGHDGGAYFEFVWIFESKELVEAARDRIRQHAEWYKDKHGYRPTKNDPKKFKDDYSIDINIGGAKMTVSASWNGYFEHLDEVDYVIFDV